MPKQALLRGLLPSQGEGLGRVGRLRKCAWGWASQESYPLYVFHGSFSMWQHALQQALGSCVLFCVTLAAATVYASSYPCCKLQALCLCCCRCMHGPGAPRAAVCVARCVRGLSSCRRGLAPAHHPRAGPDRRVGAAHRLVHAGRPHQHGDCRGECEWR